MRLRNFCEVRCEDDQLATVFDDCSEFVTRFSSYPEFVVVRIEQRYHSLVFSNRIADVNLSTNFCGTPECFTKVSGKERISNESTNIISRQDCIQGNDTSRNQIGSSFDHSSGRRVDLSDYVFDAG